MELEQRLGCGELLHGERESVHKELTNEIMMLTDDEVKLLIRLLASSRT